MRALTASLLLGLGCSASVPRSALTPRIAPTDAGFTTYADSQSTCVQTLIAPSVAQARATYSQAKHKFATGLPTGFHMALTTQVHDDSGRFEQVFIRVDSIVNGRVFGIINNDIYVVHGYHAYMHYTSEEDALRHGSSRVLCGFQLDGSVVRRFLDPCRGVRPC